MKANKTVDPGTVRLLPESLFASKMMLDLKYLLELQEDSLLQNYYLEAGINRPFGADDSMKMHGGWEDPTCQLRGHFLGHWLSAAAWMFEATGDARLEAKIRHIVNELLRCQIENGGKWAAPIPEKYLDWVARGKQVWAPHYTIHKLLMGLVDVYKLLEIPVALQVLEGLADWFFEWSGQFEYDKMQDILDVETGAMMEAFADLYSITAKDRDLELMNRYARIRYFDRLIAGEDVLTNQHANTTIPEAHGACRAYEVTGDSKWLAIAETYWNEAVTTRAAYVTGSQTQGEIWTPKAELGARLGGKNQEHCVAYNMIRLADYLYRVSGDKKYHDYIELSLYNGVLAQTFWDGYSGSSVPQLGSDNDMKVVSYFLPLEAGAKKAWGSKTNHFWCCHGSAVQACATFDRWVYYVDEADQSRSDDVVQPRSSTPNKLIINQYIPSVYEADGVKVRLNFDKQIEFDNYPKSEKWLLENACDIELALKLRVPSWSSDMFELYVDGVSVSPEVEDGYILLKLDSGKSAAVLFFPRLTTVQLSGSSRYAFRYGPYALAGLTEKDVALVGDPCEPEKLLLHDCERQWSQWLLHFKTTGQDENIVFRPLFTIGHESYTTYFEFKR